MRGSEKRGQLQTNVLRTSYSGAYSVYPKDPLFSQAIASLIVDFEAASVLRTRLQRKA